MAREPRRTDESRAPEREREVIVTDGGRSGTGIGAVIAAIIGVIVVGLIAWFLFAGGFGTADGDDASVNVDVPEEVNVDTDGGGGDAGDAGDTGGDG